MTNKQILLAIRRAEAAARKASQLAAEADAAMVYWAGPGLMQPPSWMSKNLRESADMAYGHAHQFAIYARRHIDTRMVPFP